MQHINLWKGKPEQPVRTSAQSASLKEAPASRIKLRVRLQSTTVKSKKPSSSVEKAPVRQTSPIPFRSSSCSKRKISENNHFTSADGCLDGTWSSSNSSEDEKPRTHGSPPADNTPHTVPRTPATDLRLSRLPPSKPTSFWSDSAVERYRQRQDWAETISSRLPKLSDRFVPSRERSILLSDRFRTGKEPHRLSTNERILRSEDATPDPFCFRLPRPVHTSVQPRTLRADERTRRAGELTALIGIKMLLIGTGTTTGIIPYNSITLSSTERQVRSHGYMPRLCMPKVSSVYVANVPQISASAVWSVGGIAPGPMAIDGGRGQYISSGTNAPLYTMPLTTSRPRSEDFQEKHEGRLAQALDIDRVQRVLDHDRYYTYPHCRRKNKSRPRLSTSKTIWTGTEWINYKPHPGVCF